MSDRVNAQVWLSESNWPYEEPGYVFPVRAINEVGRILFPYDWTGRECITKVEHPLPLVPSEWPKGWWDGVRAHQLLIVHRPDFGLKPLQREYRTLLTSPNKPGAVIPKVELTLTQWSAAREISQEQYEDARRTLDRFEKVLGYLIQWLRTGKLVFALRPIAGGEPGPPQPPAWWKTEHWQRRLYEWKMSSKDSFGEEGSSANTAEWILFTQKSLKTCLAGLNSVRSTNAAELRCQKWLKEMMRQSPDQRPSGKTNIYQRAKEEFGVSRDAFDRGWNKSIEETGAESWRKAGAPKKSAR